MTDHTTHPPRPTRLRWPLAALCCLLAAIFLYLAGIAPVAVVLAPALGLLASTWRPARRCPVCRREEAERLLAGQRWRQVYANRATAAVVLPSAMHDGPGIVLPPPPAGLSVRPGRVMTQREVAERIAYLAARYGGSMNAETLAHLAAAGPTEREVMAHNEGRQYIPLPSAKQTVAASGSRLAHSPVCDRPGLAYATTPAGEILGYVCTGCWAASVRDDAGLRAALWPTLGQIAEQAAILAHRD